MRLISLKGVTSEIIAEVRSRASLLEIISELVVLKRAGKEHRGLCPFHSEKTPSFYVNPEKGIYKCFGCGEGGDVFAFVRKTKGLEFLDAVTDLARRYGVRLVESEKDQEEHDKRTAILMLYQQAAEYYARLLADKREGAVAQAYLKKRGIDEQMIAAFKLGYAPSTWDGLIRYLTAVSKITPKTLEEAGLARRKLDSGHYFDLFRDRLMIPICDNDGRVIAFGGRTLNDNEVKYLNSPESPVYTKGQHLFAFHLAKDAIKARDAVLVVEGYFDAITAHQFGFQQTVATLGTALTERQAKLLVRYTESRRVYLSFDADLAGARAVERGTEMLNQVAVGVGVELRVVRVPGGKDPDECLRSTEPGAGIAAFEKAIHEASLLIDYQLESAVASIDLSTHTGRIEGAQRIVPLLAEIKNAVARGEYIRQWAVRMGIREEELFADVGQFRRTSGLSATVRSASKPGVSKSQGLKAGYIEAEQQLLALCLSSRDDYERARIVLAEESLIHPAHKAIKDSLQAIGSQFNTVEDLQLKLQDCLAPDAEASRALVEVILKVDDLNKQKVPVEVILKEGRARILRERLSQESSRLRALLLGASTEEELNTLSSKIGQLKQAEAVLLPSAKTEEDLKVVKRKIEAILG